MTGPWVGKRGRCRGGGEERRGEEKRGGGREERREGQRRRYRVKGRREVVRRGGDREEAVSWSGERNPWQVWAVELKDTELVQEIMYLSIGLSAQVVGHLART